MTEQTRRSTRLIRIRDILVRRPAGATTADLARETGYSQRTIQRDLAVIESELGLPIVFEGRRYKVMQGSEVSFGPVRFTLQEARSLYFAMRLMLRSSDERDPDALSALQKVADAIPRGMSQHMQRTVREYGLLPLNRAASEAIARITEAWATNRTIAILYRSAHAAQPSWYDVDPYILDHTQSGTYLIGYSHTHQSNRVFKVDRIKEVRTTEIEFEPVDLEQLAEALRNSWGGVVLGESTYDVVIDLTPAVADRIRESYWHVSQQLESLPDGGVRLRVSLPSLLEITPWVLSWGPEARVVAPDELRDRVAGQLRRAGEQYS